MKRILLTSALAAVATALTTINAYADCQRKLADVDKQLASAELEGMALQQYTMIRDQAEMFCNQGQEAMAMQFLTGLEQELPANKGAGKNPQMTSSDASPAISDEFLAGTWCAIVTQEQTQITFHEDGTYSACFHDSMQGRFGHCTRPESTARWLSSFKQATVIGDNEIALGNSVRSTTYKRGDCKQHGI